MELISSQLGIKCPSVKPFGTINTTDHGMTKERGIRPQQWALYEQNHTHDDEGLRDRTSHQGIA